MEAFAGLAIAATRARAVATAAARKAVVKVPDPVSCIGVAFVFAVYADASARRMVLLPATSERDLSLTMAE